LRSEAGEMIPGFSPADCVKLQINSVGARVQWKDHADVKALAGRSVRLVIEGARAKVFGFRFETGGK
jgi:hypothetical protein